MALIPYSCALCDKCWFDELRGECIYKGPYIGFRKTQNRLEYEKQLAQGEDHGSVIETSKTN